MPSSDNCDPRYEIRFFNRGGAPLSSPPVPVTLGWGRKLDAISTARIVWNVSDQSCCDDLGDIEPIAHAVGIYRNGIEEWYGWVKSVDYGYNSVSVDADDGLSWMRRRVLHSDLSWTNVDLSAIFEDIYNDAMAPDPIGVLRVVTTASGVSETRVAKVSENRYAWNVIREMLDTGLDVTCVGRTIIAGLIHTGRPMELSLSDVQGEPRVTKDGAYYGNRVIFDASEQVQAVYPPGPPAANSQYPLVEVVVKDSQVQDTASAANAAKSRYEYSRRVPRLISLSDGIQLQPSSILTVRDLVPGALMNVNTEGICYSRRETFRIGSVDVNVAGGVETVQLSLQPTGPETTLAAIDEPSL